MTRPLRSLITLLALALLTACGGNPLATSTATSTAGSTAAASATVTIGSANFPESEIIAEIYAQALEAKGVKVERRMQIGARDVYVAALKDDSIDLIPEYTGNLLQYFDKATTAKTADEVTKALGRAAGAQGLVVFNAAAAEDKDSYNVTKEFSQKNNVTSLADLKNYTGTLRLGGNPELATRPYGPPGLTSVYGVPADRITFTPISDGGGPLTVKALKDGDVDIADIYSTTPAITENGFVTLADPQNLIMPQNVIPLASTRVTDARVKVTLDAVSAKLTTEDLLALNGENQGANKTSPKAAASAWLKAEGLV